jgi:hypothetical protein
MQNIHSFSKDSSIDGPYGYFTNNLYCKTNAQISLPISIDYLDKLIIKIDKIFD